ncbi:MAG: hypothetical protein ACRD0P_04380 [Stackebrandtia sp.]
MQPVSGSDSGRRLIDRLAVLRSELDQERAIPEADRATTASDAALDAAIREVSQAAELLADGGEEAALTALTRTALRVVDSWSYASPVSEAIVSRKQDLQHMVDKRFAREWATGNPPASTPPDDETAERSPGRLAALPWWSRALLIVGLAVAAVCGVSALYSMELLSVAGPYVAPVLVLAAIAMTLTWFSGRTTRLRARAVRELRELAPLLRSALAARTSAVSDESLHSALTAIEEALRSFAHHGGDSGAAGIDRLGHLASTWPSRNPLAVRVARLSRIGRRLSRAARNTDHLETVLKRQTQPEDRRAVKSWDRWFIRFPVWSLFACLGCVGLYQADILPPLAAVLLACLSILAIAAVHYHQQTRE